MAEKESKKTKEAEESQTTVEIRDTDTDSAHILPLSFLDLKTTSLNRARMVKNSRLEGVIEIFDDIHAGSGQIEVDSLSKEFNWPVAPPHPDLVLLRKLAELPSYDVYSLRLLLRDLEIPINNLSDLSLSESKKTELTAYMKEFTRPLISQIYGEDDKTITDLEGILSLFREPDVEKAREKLQIMADQLKIEIQDIPKFLEDYGDVYLSLSYFKNGLKAYESRIDIFLDAVTKLREHTELKKYARFMKASNIITTTINHVFNSNKERFKYFEKYTKDMWDDISADRFHDVEKTIKSYHTTIGGGFCTLSVKIDAWTRKFPTNNAGGPIQRSDFIMSDMVHGIDNILEMERTAPPLLGQKQAAGQPPEDKAEKETKDSNNSEDDK
jgi:hypothetical protein